MAEGFPQGLCKQFRFFQLLVKVFSSVLGRLASNELEVFVKCPANRFCF